MRKDITGMRFGKLTAVRIARKDKRRESKWLCVCECGRETEVRLWNLLHENTKSCGCMNGR